MIRLIFWILIIAAVMLVGGLFAQMMLKDSGVIMMSWNGWLIETTFWSGLGILLTLIILIYIIRAIWKRFAPTRLLSTYRTRRDKKAAKKETAIAIESWLKGADDRALQSLDRVARAGGSERLPQAVSLAVGLTHGDWNDRYAKFINEDAELKMFANALQAERFWQMNNSQDFIDLMLGHFELRQVTWLRERLWQMLLDANRAAELIPMVNEAANIVPETREAWLVKAAKAALANCHGNQEKGSKLLKTVPKTIKQMPDVMASEVRYLVSIGQHDLAFKRLKTILSKPNLLAFSDLLVDIKLDASAKLNFLESLQPTAPGPVYCRTAGILSLQQQLWGNAQSWLEQAWQQGDKIAAVKLAQLFEQRNMHDQAGRLHRELASAWLTVK